MSNPRVSIPNHLRKTVQTIKEITSNHSEDDIFAMLKECSMDPNETTQRLLHLDSFHEVKKKRDKRKENVRSRPAEESRGRPGYQGRGNRGARGSSYSQYATNDSGGRRNAATWKENGVEESREKGFKRSSVAVCKETDPTQPRPLNKSSSICMNGPVEVPNGTINGHGAQSSGGGDTGLSNKSVDGDNSSSPMSKASAECDPVLVPSRGSCTLTAVGAIKCEVRPASAEPNGFIPADRGLGTTESMSDSHTNQHEAQIVDGSEVSSSMIEKEAPGHLIAVQPKVACECPEAKEIHHPDKISVVEPSSAQGAEEAESKLEKLKFSNGQHVIIPNHIQVPDAVKNILSFGSIDACLGVKENCANSASDKNSYSAADSPPDETASKPLSCDQDMVSTAPEVQHVDPPQSPSHVIVNSPPSDIISASSASVPRDDLPKEEALPAVGPPFPVVQTTPSYSFGFMPPMLANPLVQHEVFTSQAHDSNSQNESSPAMTSESNPPPTQSSGAGQSSVALSPPPIAIFRQPYPHNYFPYTHYFPPFYVPPTMHQYFGHTAFPQPLPTGNMYIPQPAPAAGMKVSSAPYKSGVNPGNQAPVGIVSGYGAYSSPQVGFSPNAAVASGNSSSAEDLVPSVLKENNVYPVQQGQNEGSTVWLPAAGRDTGSYPLNSFLNIPPQGQHLITPQSGPGPFAIYHSLQPMAAPAPGMTLLQQSQPMPGSVEPVGPPSNATYQQQPHRQQQQMNWNM